ncbi:MAG: oligosaccharide flippase family protein [Methanobacteriota archaeon]
MIHTPMIARKSFVVASAEFISSFIGWIGLVVLARLWGGFAPEAMGVIGFAMSFLGLFTIIGQLGFHTAHIKRISEGKDLGTCIGTYITIKLFLTTLMIAAIIGTIVVMKIAFNKEFYDATTEPVIIVFLIYYIITNLRDIPQITFNGTKEIAKLEFLSLSENFVKIPLMILVALAGVTIFNKNIAPVGSWPGILKPAQTFLAAHAYGALAMTYTLGALAGLLLGIWFMRKYPLKKPNLDYIKNYSRYALPITMVSGFRAISMNIDKVMIGYFWTATEVGYYFTIQQILMVILILSQAVTTVLFPTVSQYHAEKNFDKIRDTTALTERHISLVIIPMITVLIVFAGPVINLMLPAYLPAKPVLIILLLYTFVSSLTMPYTSLINGINKPDISAIIGVLTCISAISLNLLFIPASGLLSPFKIYGATGAACAAFASSFIGFVGYRLAARKLIGMKIWQTHTPRHLIAGICTGIIMYSLGVFLQEIHWYTFILLAFITLGIYLGILYLIREFTKDDLHFYLDLIHPKKVLMQVREELKKQKPE